MDNNKDSDLKSGDQAVEAFVSQVLDGACVERLMSVPEAAEQRLQLKEGLRHKAFEVFADAAFYKAAQRLIDALDDDDPDVAVKAASKLIDMRRDVYKTQSNKKQVKAVMDKLFDDGFDF